MRIKLPHAPYIARKVALDLRNCGFVTFKSGLDPVITLVQSILEVDINKERALEEKVKELLDHNEDEMDFMQVDRKNMFWLVKKKLADEFDVILSYEDRYSAISHEILESLWKNDLIDYNVSENKAKNVIFASIQGYLKTYQDIEESVASKLENYKRKLIAGTEEYDLVFEKMYVEELKKRGMI